MTDPLTRREEAGLATTQASPLMMLQAALDKGADPEKLGKLMDLAERWKAGEDAQAFSDALRDFQAECPVIAKGRGVSLDRNDKSNIAYRYASYDDIMAVVQPLLAKHELSIRFDMSIVDGNCAVTCHLTRGRHTVSTSVSVPVPNEMRVNASQKMGAAVSYSKRYAIINALNLTVGDVDDDAANLDQAAPHIEAITLDQVQTIEDLITETKTDRAKFLAWAGVGSLGDMPKAKYAQAVSLLQSKRGHK